MMIEYENPYKNLTKEAILHEELLKDVINLDSIYDKLLFTVNTLKEANLFYSFDISQNKTIKDKIVSFEYLNDILLKAKNSLCEKMYFLIVDKIDFSNNRIICNIIQNRKKELNEYIIEKALMKINKNYE